MNSLMEHIAGRAGTLGVPLTAHLDLTYKCNEGCGHCYLDHSMGGDMNTAEVKSALDQLAAAGAFFLTISGGEIMLRKDIFEIVGHARSLMFDVTLKTNGILISDEDAERFAHLGVHAAHISIYSHRPEVHDGITRVPGSLERSIQAARNFTRHGVAVELRCAVMQQNEDDYHGVQDIARELGVETKYDPMITPGMDGDFTPVAHHHISTESLRRVLRDPLISLDPEKFCAPPTPVDDQVLNKAPCSAGHTAVYITPQGDVTPCVQFPLVCGNLRHESFAEIWQNSPAFAKVRGMRNRNVTVCNSCSNLSSCNRCPGLAYMEGNMEGPSSLDCEKTYARTGVPSPLTVAAAAHPGSHRPRSSVLIPLEALLPAAPARPHRDLAAS